MSLQALTLGVVASIAGAQEDRLQGPPLHYERPAKAGPVERLTRALDAQAIELAHDADAGYLPALLDALDVPVSSQVLVFSKTSFQNERISPGTPRAVYFGDDAYVGWIPGAPFVEVTSIDPDHGPVFYALEQRGDAPPRFTRRDAECLQCHASSRTQGWPGNLVRSVHPDRDGLPILRSGTDDVTHATPFEDRWGGWYVTGTHGGARHRGNATAHPETELVDPEQGANVKDLSPFFDTGRYPSQHSDIVALLVLEHQAEMHNVLARAAYEIRTAFFRQEEMNRHFGELPGTLRPATRRLIELQSKRLLDYMLFRKEARLPAPVRGTSSFAREFQRRGKRDEHGRSLRDLDLDRYLFRYPCSYLIHSRAFAALPPALLETLYRDLWAVLNAPPTRNDSTRLRASDLRAIREILLATKDDLPDAWR